MSQVFILQMSNPNANSTEAVRRAILNQNEIVRQLSLWQKQASSGELPAQTQEVLGAGADLAAVIVQLNNARTDIANLRALVGSLRTALLGLGLLGS